MASETTTMLHTNASQTFRTIKTRAPFRQAVFVFESLLVLSLYAYLMFLRGIEGMRRTVLLAYGIIYLMRLDFMALYLLPREISVEELTFVMIIWVPGILASFACLVPIEDPMTLTVLAVSIVAYAGGSYLNTVSEWQRKVWKTTHPGKCYTKGLFAYSRNINYFGDVILFSGWAVATSSWWNTWVPLVMASSFYFFHIPAKEEYLTERYGNDWIQYRESTKSFIPMVC